MQWQQAQGSMPTFQEVADRLRQHVARYVFLADCGDGSRLTASVGVASLPAVAKPTVAVSASWAERRYRT